MRAVSLQEVKLSKCRGSSNMIEDVLPALSKMDFLEKAWVCPEVLNHLGTDLACLRDLSVGSNLSAESALLIGTVRNFAATGMPM